MILEEVVNMKKNVGEIDSYIRYIIGFALIILAIVLTTWWIALIAIIPIVTAATKFCILYVPFGIDTTKKDDNQKEKK